MVDGSEFWIDIDERSDYDNLTRIFRHASHVICHQRQYHAQV